MPQTTAGRAMALVIVVVVLVAAALFVSSLLSSPGPVQLDLGTQLVKPGS